MGRGGEGIRGHETHKRIEFPSEEHQRKREQESGEACQSRLRLHLEPKRDAHETGEVGNLEDTGRVVEETGETVPLVDDELEDEALRGGSVTDA